MMRRTCLLLSLATVQALFSVSCSVPGVRELTRPITDSTVVGTLLNPKKLTPETKEYLKEQRLVAAYRKDPAAVISELRQKLASDSSHTSRMALIELCSDMGDRLANSSPAEAGGYHLAAAELAYQWASTSPRDELQNTELVAAYNHNCGQVARALARSGLDWGETTEIEGPGKTYRLKCRTKGEGLIDPSFFDTIEPAAFLKLEKTELERIQKKGVGAAMVGHRMATPERREANPYLPPVGMGIPVNSTLEFSRAGGDVELVFHDLMIRERAVLGGRSVPLEADLTAPLAFLLNYKKERNIGISGLRNPEDYMNSMGLYQLEPYRPDQIPVVFVHGLVSSPETWLKALNQFRSDPVLRKKYQLYVFRYPTGFPIAYNAAALRRRLKEFQEDNDPGRRNPGMRKMVLIGHSMGGMLSNIQVRSSGDTFSKMLFDQPIDDIDELSSAQKASLNELLNFKANPNVTRAVFVASPHRGSDLAESPIGNFGASLIKFPMELITVEPLPAIDSMTETGREIVENRPDSIGDLKPDAPGPKAVLSMPVRSGVVIHSIIGRHKPNQPLLESTDTVVPYTSAHLDEAVSEKVVEATHTTITGNAEAIEELRRILYLHAGLRY